MNTFNFDQIVEDLVTELQKDKQARALEASLLKRILVAVSCEGNEQDVARKFLDLLGDKQCLALELIEFQIERLRGLSLYIQLIMKDREINQLADKAIHGGNHE